MSHACSTCGKTFTRKDAMTRHASNPNGCSKKTIEDKIADTVKKTVATLKEEIIEGVKEELNDGNKFSESAMLNLGNKLHNYMRAEQVIGSKAMHNIMKLLCMRFMQPLIKPGGKLETLTDPTSYLSKELDADGKPKYVDGFEEINLQYLDVDKLLSLPDSDGSFENMFLKIWKRVLAKHPFTEKIFKARDYFTVSSKCLRKCLTEICTVLKNMDFDNLDHDVKGSLYEHFINGYSDKGGKEFGQFFTPRNMIKLVSKLNKQYFEIIARSIYDPCMGTAGFLTEMYKEHKSSLTDLNVSGGELEPDTYAIALMNVILTTGSTCNIKCCDSLANNENVQYGLIGTNPPFGMKGIKYEEVLANCAFENQKSVIKKSTAKEAKQTAIEPTEMYPIKTNDGSALFLQHCIAKLAIDGVCNIVLPDGQLFSGKTFIKLRKYLLTSCNLVAILNAPNGAFTNASVKTAVLFFTKEVDADGNPVPTKQVDFYTCNKECTEYTLSGTVTFDQLENKSYNLNYSTYEEKKSTFIDYKCEIKTLGEVCELVKGKHSTTKTIINSEGESKFITVAAENKWQNCDIIDFDEDAVFVSNVSSGAVWPVHYYNGKFAYCDLLRMLKVDRTVILPKYLYYYLKIHVQNDIMEQYIKGAANKSLDVDKFNDIQIPIPSIEAQQQIILDCQMYEKKKDNLTEYISILKQEAECIHRMTIKPLFTDETIEKKTLGEVCEINQGKSLTKENIIPGEYPVMGGGKIIGYHNTFNMEKYSIILTRVGDPNINWCDTSYYLTDNGFALTQKIGSNIILKYIYYYMNVNIATLSSMYIGTAQKVISKTALSAIQIPISSLEKQQQIINQYEEKMKSINEFKNKINVVEKLIAQTSEDQKALF